MLLSVFFGLLSFAPVPSLAAATPCDRDATVSHQVAPEYPQTARETGLGRVTATVRVYITPHGTVGALRVIDSTGNGDIDRAALRAAAESTYLPRMKNCKPARSDSISIRRHSTPISNASADHGLPDDAGRIDANGDSGARSGSVGRSVQSRSRAASPSTAEAAAGEIQDADGCGLSSGGRDNRRQGRRS
jgi:TonB family protein